MKVSLVIALLLSCVALMALPLSGPYSVGGTGADFSTLNLAIAALNSQGMSGNVSLNLNPGTYAGPFLLSFPDSGFTLTISSGTFAADQVILTNPSSTSTTNYVLRISESSHVRIEDLTFNTSTSGSYSRAVEVQGDCDDLNFVSNVFYNAQSMSTSNNEGVLIYPSAEGDADDIHFFANSFYSGGVHILISSSSSADDFNDWSFISNGHTGGYGAVSLIHASDLVFAGLIVENVNTGIYLSQCNGSLNMEKNQIRSWSQSVYLSYCSPDNSVSPQIRNNILKTTGQSWYGSSYPVASQTLILENCGAVIAAHNSIRNDSGSADSYAASVSGSNNLLKLNSFVSNGPGRVIYGYNCESGSANRNKLEYNVIYTNGLYLMRHGNLNIITMSDINALLGNSTNLDLDPLYSDELLHTPSPWLNNSVGTAGVSTDFNDLPRSLTTPDIGAHEFTPAAGLTPLAGSYTVGSGGNFSTLAEAAYALSLRGISANVTLNLTDASYNEQVTFKRVHGVSVTSGIVIQGSGSTPREISFSGQTAAANYMIKLVRSEHLTLQYLNFITSSTTYSGMIYAPGLNSDLRLLNCSLTAPSFEGYAGGTTLSNSYSDQLRNVDILATNFHGNHTAISAYIDGLTVGSCVFDDMSQAIVGNPIDHAEIVGNSFTNMRGTALTLNNGTYYEIFRNTISGTGSGINLSGTCDPVNRSLVANNAILLSGGNGQTGISLGGSGYDVLNNSVQVSGTYAKGFYTYDFPANVDLVNNIFSVTDGLALEVNYYSPAANKLIDHNCYYSTGTELLTLGGSFTSLAGLQSAYPTSNQHSLSLNPHFSTDMHTQSYWLRHVGATRSEFSDDMDLEPRTGGYDIGADQQTGPLVNPVMSGLYTIGASGCNFTDLQSFFDAISLYGINGDVIVTLTPGVYAGNNHLESYYRTSSAYGISILGTTGSSFSYVNALGDYSQNYIIKLNGADKVTLNGITCNLLSGSYSGSAIMLTGRCDDLTIANSSFVMGNSGDTAINGGTSVGSNLRLVNSTIQGGATGLSTSGSYYGTLSYTDVEVTDCTFTGTDYPLSLNKLIGVSITGNSFTDFITGVNLNYATGDILISGNRLRSGGYYGSFSGGTCMNLGNVNGSASSRGQILSNLIYADNSQCQGLNGLIIGYSSYLNLDHNSIYVENVNANDYGSALNLSSVSQISSYNNIFSSPVNGYAVNVTGTDLLWSHNVYYSAAKFLGSFSNTVYDPGTLIALYLNDAAGIYANPIPDTNGYSQCSFLRGEGTLTAVTTDIDGNPHSNPPDPGATLIPNFGAPLAGTVNVGSSGTFPDLPTALTALIRRGISAAVTLQLSPGNQPVHASLSYVPNSLLFPVTITGNPVNAPILTHTATSDADNYILRLINTYNLTLSNLAFHSGNTLHALNLELRGYTKDLSVDNCTFSVNPNTTNSLSSTAVLLSSFNYDGISLTNNHITNLSYGFHIYGANVSNRLNTGLELTGNTIANPAVGIYLGYSDSAVIASNEITGFRYWGARLNYGLPELYVANNRITGDGNAGLSLYNLGTDSGDSYITNNYIRTGVGASGTLTMESSTNVHSYFNTLVNTYPSASGAAFWQGSGCSGLSFVNNICRSSGAKAASFNQMSDLVRRDHNLFYTTGSTVVSLGGAAINSLSAWATATGDNSSLFADPLLENDSYVLPGTSPAVNSGIALDGFGADIEGSLRILPDMGCYEYTLGTLSAPQNLQISIDEGTGMILLSWTPVTSAAGYKVYRNTLPVETGWNPITTGETSLQIPISSGYKFFRVTAVDSR